MLRGGAGQVYHPGQLERGESGNVHLQYIVQFTTAKRLNGVRAAVSDQTHWEPIYGSIAQARAYVTKGSHEDRWPVGYGQIAFREAQGLRRGRRRCYAGDAPQRSPRSSRHLGRPAAA